MKLSVKAAKIVSKKRIFNKIFHVKMRELSTKFVKHRSLAKMQWAVRAFQEWRQYRLHDFVKYDCKIFETNFDDVQSPTKDNLVYSLCKFIPEVMKVKDGAQYPGATLYQIVFVIQHHISKKGIN